MGPRHGGGLLISKNRHLPSTGCGVFLEAESVESSGVVAGERLRLILAELNQKANTIWATPCRLQKLGIGS